MRTIFILLVALFVAGCGGGENLGATKIVFVGDSITKGSYLEVQESYTDFPQRFINNLPIEFPNTTWTITNNGVDGANTQNWVDLWLESKITDLKPNIVVIMLGTNDAAPVGSNYTYGDQHVNLAVFETNLRTIITAINNTDNNSGYNGDRAEIILMTPPPVNEAKSTSGRTNAITTQYAQKVRDIADSTNVHLIDVWNEIYQYHGQPSYSSYFFASDGVHLDDPGHTLIYNLLHTKLLEILNDEGLLPSSLFSFGEPVLMGRTIYGSSTLPVSLEIGVTNIIKVINDDLNLSEAKSRLRGMSKTVTDQLSVSEATQNMMGKVKIINESVNTEESVRRLRGLLRVITRGVGVNESVWKARGLARTISEVVGVPDSLTQNATPFTGYRYKFAGNNLNSKEFTESNVPSKKFTGSNISSKKFVEGGIN